MKKTRKATVSFDSFCAMFSSSYLFFSQDPTMFERFHELRQEQTFDLVFRKELLSNLSEDAKTVVKFLFTAPTDVIESLSPPNYKRPTMNTLRRYFFKEGWQHKVIDTTFEELKEYAKQLSMIE